MPSDQPPDSDFIVLCESEVLTPLEESLAEAKRVAEEVGGTAWVSAREYERVRGEAEQMEAENGSLQTEAQVCREDLNDTVDRMNDALQELRCPECGCADEIDATSNECGCDTPLCRRTYSDGTLAESWLRQHDRLAEIAAIIEAVDNRCAAVDGPVTPTMAEMTAKEMRRIYQLAKGTDDAE